MTDKKFDIFDVISKISQNDIAFFDRLADYEVKQIYPFVVMKWMGGTKTGNQIKLLNEVVNTTCFKLHKHPKLLYKMLMVSSVSKDRVSWVKRKTKEKNEETLCVIEEYYDCSRSDAIDYLRILTNDDILEIAETLGIEKEKFTKLKKELNG
jgi:hypothetical protein